MVTAMHPKGKLRCRIAAAPAVAGRERMREREREKIRSRELTRKCDHGGLRFEGPMCGTPSPCFVDAAGARPGKKAGEGSFAAALVRERGRLCVPVC